MRKNIAFLVLLTIFTLIFCVSCFGFNAVITWSKVPDTDLAGYSLYQSNDGIKYKKIVTVQSTATKITLHNQSKYVDVYWYLVSVDLSGNESNRANIVRYKH